MGAEDGPAPAFGAASPQAVTATDLEAFKLLAARGAVESELRGSSMGEAIPDGVRVRISRSAGECRWQPGDVLAFLGGSRIMVHRVAYVAGEGAALGYLITHGDGNWICDPPIESSAVAGTVRDYLREGEWRPVGPARMSRARRVTFLCSLWLLRAVLVRSPRAALLLARWVSYGRNAARGTWTRLSSREDERVRD
jgi:hypothetical protein